MICGAASGQEARLQLPSTFRLDRMAIETTAYGKSAKYPARPLRLQRPYHSL